MGRAFFQPKIWICTILLALALAPAAPFALARESAPEQCLDAQVCPIPYVRLSKQSTEPFIAYGEVVEEGGPQYGNYRRALRRFPDVRSCLTEAERERAQPDLRQVDWKLMNDTYDIEVCVFRIASSVSSIAALKQCLQYNKFHVRDLISTINEDHIPESDLFKFYMLQSFLPIAEYRKIIPRSWFMDIIDVELNTGLSVIVYFSKSRNVVGVTSSVLSRFDE